MKRYPNFVCRTLPFSGSTMGALTLLVQCAAPAAGDPTLVIQGVLGNSGQAGKSLVKSQYSLANAPLLAGGAYVDEVPSVWVSGGDRINRLTLDGQLMASFAMEPPGIVVSEQFAVQQNRLFFLAQIGANSVRIFSLDMAGKDPARAFTTALPARQPEWEKYVLCPQVVNGKLLLLAGHTEATGKDAADNLVGVYAMDANSGESTPLFRVPGRSPKSLNWDGNAQILTIGGSLVPLQGTANWTSGYLRRTLTGKEPEMGSAKMDVLGLPAIPSWYPGRASFVQKTMWDLGQTYGFIARRQLDGSPAPGTIARWEHQLDYPMQMVEVPGSNAMVLSSDTPDACHLLGWDPEQNELVTQRRLGSLPYVVSLGINARGLVTAGTLWTQLFWNFDDEASAPPLQADMLVASSPPVWKGDEFFAFSSKHNALAALKGVEAPGAYVFGPAKTARNSANTVISDAQRYPFKKPVGVSLLTVPNAPVGNLLVVDAATKALYAMPYDIRSQTPRPGSSVHVVLEDLTLEAPTDVAALRDGRVLLADSGKLLVLKPTGTATAFAGNSLSLVKEWNGGAVPFGESIRFAVQGRYALVADTLRHRVLLCDWEQGKVLGQVGETDRPGSDALHLDNPTLVALENGRGVVADSGNQRLIKLRVWEQKK